LDSGAVIRPLPSSLTGRYPALAGVVRVGAVCYYAKGEGGRVNAAAMHAKLPHLELRRCGPYLCNDPDQERFAALLAEGWVNVVDIRLPHELPGVPGRDGPRRLYYSRDACSYRPGELPVPDPHRAWARLFVFNLLTRNGDACESNCVLCGGVPLLFDLGETFNPHLAPIEAFIDAIGHPHAAGHYCYTWQFAANYRPARAAELAEAMQVALDLDPAAVGRRAVTVGCREDRVAEWVEYLRPRQASLVGDVERVTRCFRAAVPGES